MTETMAHKPNLDQGSPSGNTGKAVPKNIPGKVPTVEICCNYSETARLSLSVVPHSCS